MFAVSPVTNLASRYQETRADRYAIEMTKILMQPLKRFKN